MFSVCESQCDSEENVQCVPTSFDDNPRSQDSQNNPGTSQQVSKSPGCKFIEIVLRKQERANRPKNKGAFH